MTDLKYEDPRHIDHEKLQELAGSSKVRTAEINGQRYRLFTLKEYLSNPNATVTRWEAFELVALIDQRMRYEKLRWRAWAWFVENVLNTLPWVELKVRRPPKYLKIPLGRIHRRSS